MWSFITIALLLAVVKSVPTESKYSDVNRDNENINVLELETKLEPNTYQSNDPESTMGIMDVIHYHGYQAEEYDVTTKDGYIITIHRIPYGKDGPSSQPRKPVILQHGFLCNSAIWVINTPDQNLGYLLADAGYDVWLTNIRGNNFGRKHTTLSPDDKEFWSFSFDQMAEFDMPAIIDFVLQKTGFSQTHYIGHSMGTTIPFAMLSTQLEYNNKLRSFLALSAVAKLTSAKGPIRLLGPIANDLYRLLAMFGGYEFDPNSEQVEKFSKAMCVSPIKELCASILFTLLGYDREQFNLTRMPVYLHHEPAGTSTQNIAHCAQILLANQLQYYDLGHIENQKKYGQSEPPEYDLSKITTPVAIFWSDNDWLAAPEDVIVISQQLESLVMKYRVPFENFAHIDYMWAIDVKKLLYDKVLEVLQKLWPD